MNTAPVSFTAQRLRMSPLLQKLLFAGGFFAAAGFNPNLVYAQVSSSVGANTVPTGGTVAQGNAVIGTAAIAANGRNTLAINQTSTAAVLNWSSFNVGSNGTVSFQQPVNGVTLNRVNSNQGSEIYGQINATGHIFLVNPAGILFAPGAQVNVGGLVASTLDITDNNFILGSKSGNYQFNSTSRSIYAGQPSNSLVKAGEITNQGTLTASDGGTVALLGQTVRNDGIIAARLGSVALAAGNNVTLEFQGSRLLKVQVSQAEFDTLVDNKGIIRSEGGWVLMNAQTAAGLARAVVNHSGVIEAQTVADLQGNSSEGKVEILADFNHGTVNASGSVDISAPDSIALYADSMPATGQKGLKNGGFLDTSAANVQIANSFKVNATAANGNTGNWLIDPNDFTITAGSNPQTGSGIGADTLSSNLGTANVTIATADAGSEAGDILVNGNVTWANANSLTLNAHRNIDFTGGGSLNGGATGNVNLNAGSAGAGAIIGGTGTAVTANTLIATAQTGIGSSTQALNTKVSNAALTNSASGGIYLSNGRDANGNGIDLTVAARSTNGDVVIKGADGIDGAQGINGSAGPNGALGQAAIGRGQPGSLGLQGELGGQGASITVGTVAAIEGIRTLVSGDIHIRAGNGGKGGDGGQGGNGGDGFFNSSGPVVSQGGADGGPGNFGGLGGSVTVLSDIHAAGDAVIQAGAGGAGGAGGKGGSGGNAYNDGVYPDYTTPTTLITYKAADNFECCAGGDGNFGGNGAAGGTGGSVIVQSAITAGGDLRISAGAGGAGGAGGRGGNGGNGNDLLTPAPQHEINTGRGGFGRNGGNGANGGAGGSIQLNVPSLALTSIGTLELSAGAGGARGAAGKGGHGGYYGLNSVRDLNPPSHFIFENGRWRNGFNTPDGLSGLADGVMGSISATGNLTLQAQDLILNASSITADILTITAGSGLGTALNPLQTNTNQLALHNTTGGGIHVVTSKNVTVAARSVNGDVVIQGALVAGVNGAKGADYRIEPINNTSVVFLAKDGSVGGQGGETSITVGVVGALAGITTVGSGDVRLTGGNGGQGGAGGNGGDGAVFGSNNVISPGGNGGKGGVGGNGGSIRIDQAVVAAGDVSFASGSGGRGGDGGAPGHLASIGGQADQGGSGGHIILNAAVNAQGAITLQSTGIAGQPGTPNPAAPPVTTPPPAPVASQIFGSSIDLRAGSNLTIDGAWGAITGNVRLQNGMRAGNTFSLSNSSLNVGSNSILIGASTLPTGLNLTAARVELESLSDITSLAGITLSTPDLALRSHGQIGQASSPLAINSVTNSLWLETGANFGRGDAASIGSGSANVILTRNHNFGATIRNGNLDVNVGNGIGYAPNVQVVGTPFGSGITVTADAAALAAGKGNVAIAAGLGLDGQGNGGAGSQGGNVLVAGNISAAGDILLRALDGGAGASSAVGNGGAAGAGGAVTLGPGAQLQGRSLNVISGSGRNGGNGASGFGGGDGGSAGDINLSAGAALNFTGGVTLQSGSGGQGGTGTGYSWGGHGGRIDYNSITSGGDVTLQTGSGGQIGASTTGGAITSFGGGGGTISGNVIQAMGNLTVNTGNGGHGRAGGDWYVQGAVSAHNISASLGASGSNAASSAIRGDAVDLTSRGNMQINGAIAPTSGSANLTAATFSGSLNASGHQLNITTPGGASAWNLSGISADILTIDAQNGIGSSSQALNTSVNQAALTNSIGGGIYLTNSGDITVAARSTNGDVVIRTADGANGVSAGGNGGNITVGTVTGLVGITATDSSALGAIGNISLTTGQGGSGQIPGHGGLITLNAAVNAARDALLVAGAGSTGLNASGSGGNGGAITVGAALQAGRDVVLTSGVGGTGGNGQDGSNGSGCLDPLCTTGIDGGPGLPGGAGGAGGGIVVSAAINAGRDLLLTAAAAGAGGNGGAGGSGEQFGVGNRGTQGPSGAGGIGGNAGAITLSAPAAAGRNAALIAGVGGAGGVTGAGGPQVASGSTGRVEGTQIDVQAAGNITVQSVIAPTSGAVNLTAGTGISNGAGGAVQVQASQLNLRNGTSGDVLVSNTGNIAFTGGASNVSKAHVVSTAGNITLDSALNATGAGDAIRLAGVNFINNAGASALSTPAGRWIVWSTSPQASRFGGLQSGSAALWSTAYNSASPTVSETGNRFAFTLAQPTGVAIAASDVVKTYGDAVDFSGASLGHGYSLISLGSGASFGNAFTDVGISVAGITLTGTPMLSSAGAAGTATRTGGNGGGATYDIVLDLTGVTASNSAGAVNLEAPVNGTLTITPRAVSVRANDVTQTYNGQAFSGGNADITGLASFDNAATLGTLSYSGSAQGAVNAGSYLITPGGLANANYSISYTDGNLNINKAALTVTAENATRTYDGTNYSGGNGVSYNGFVHSETISALGGSLTYGGSAQGSRNAGTYTITPGGLTAQNYDIAFTSGSLTTGKADLTINATTDSRVYNGLAVSNAAPSAIGIVVGDSFTASQNFDSPNAGNRTLNVSSYTINDGNNGNNYNVNLQSANGTITPASLIIQANNASMIQGQTVPLLTAAYLGLVGNDTPANFGTPALLNTVANSQTGQGTYTITPSGASSPNYIVSYVNGQLTISPAPLPVTILQPGVGGGGGSGAATGAGSGSGSSSQNNGNSASSFSVETQEQQNARLGKSSQLITVVDGGVKQ